MADAAEDRSGRCAVVVIVGATVALTATLILWAQLRSPDGANDGWR